MEDAFISLYQEFQVLQSVCKKQAELIEKLLSKKGIASEMPFSKPVQCSDVGDPACTESPFFRLHGIENPYVESSKPKTDEIPNTSKEPEEHPSVLLDFDVHFPPNTEQYSFLASENEQVEFAVGSSKSQHNTDKRSSTTDLELFIKNYTPQFQNANGGGDKLIGNSVAGGLDFLIPPKADQTFNLSNFYEDLCYLQSKDISFGECSGPENKHPIGIRGPAQSSWTPVCLSEECQLGCHLDTSSDIGLSSQICDFCQAIFPAGSATKGEYLRHITGHVE
ncbi:Hypothetical predicted protein [Pelobates cultripes]|uniref:Tbk1/Ikki binding domain-containing protein n=1 Tax=Pelobates cultripes TaxID=61616 RepID=A0AAD1R6P2_PELCU|nr:Hypothetical predicted protein [Pelobates cultripes]